MLATISAEDFAPHVGKPCRASHSDGLTFDLVIDSVEEMARQKRPQDIRAPFSVLLKGPLAPSFLSGTLDLAIDGEPFLPGVHIERIAPPWGLDPDSAYYQMIFN